MRGLLLKDFLMIKGNIKSILLFFVVFCLIALEGNDFLFFVPSLIGFMMFMTTFSYDEYNKWGLYAITLPIERKKIVLAKYLGSAILLVFSLVITFLVAWGIGIYNQNFDVQKTFTLLLSCGGSILFLQDIVYPLFIKFGVEKGRIGLFLGLFFISFLLGWILKNISISIPQDIYSFLTTYLPWILVVFLLLFTIGSYKIAERIYTKKEF